MALGAVALFVPLAAGRWSLSLLAVPLFASSVVQAYGALTSPQRVTASVYLPSLLTMLAGLLLFFSSALVINGLLLLLIAILAMGGFSKILIAWRAEPSSRSAIAVNGLIDLSCAALLWSLSGLIRVEQAIGIATGAYIAAAGWRLLAAPAQAAEPEAPTAAATSHPDPKLCLPPSETFARLRAEAKSGARTVLASDFTWMLTLAVVFFAIHLGRMPISDTVLGLSSPFVATAGDLFMAAVLGLLLVLPAHLLWKRITRPVERLAWSLRLDPKPGAAPNPAADWLISRWLEGRFNFDLRLDAARNSLRAALILVLGLGLPLTAFFVAFNPAWGFTWYFNTESWATGVYQKLTEARVDDWRAAMTGAVRRAYGGESDDLFAIDPGGLEGSRDFSFLVVGDPGEGDASQYALISRYLELGRRDDVKFLVVSSDVIYPAGAIEDYERNFYLPFQGFAKPVYAIPGNHDWYDALEGFQRELSGAEGGASGDRSARRSRPWADQHQRPPHGPARSRGGATARPVRRRRCSSKGAVLRIADTRLCIAGHRHRYPAQRRQRAMGLARARARPEPREVHDGDRRSSPLRWRPRYSCQRRKAGMSRTRQATLPRSIASWRTAM